MIKTNDKSKESFFTKFLKHLEESGNKLPSPAMVFFLLGALIIVVSSITTSMGVSVDYEVISEGVATTKSVATKSLLSPDGWNFITSQSINNFKNFYALGVVLTIMLMVGVAQGSGLLDAIVYRIAKVTPPSLITPVVAFIGIMLSVASSTGYVVLVPLAAILYLGVGRHPIAGVAVAFAATSAGWGANLLIAPNDPALAAITQDAIQIINPEYSVNATANWYVAFVSVFLLTIIITLVDKYLISPLLGDYSEEVDEDHSHRVNNVSVEEKRGLQLASISALIYLAIIVSLLVSGYFGGFGKFIYTMNSDNTYTLIGSPFLSGIIIYMGFLFIIPGIFYGIGAKTIKSEKDIVRMMEESMRSLAPFIVIIFFAAQFTAYFTYTNLGQIIAVSGANFLESIGLTSIWLFVIFVIIMAFLNLFMAVDTAKWAIIAPIFVPLFYQLGYSPELTQMFYRIGDSSSNIIAPLMPFFPLVLSIIKKYDKNAGMGTLISTMIPYTVSIMVTWTIFLLVWVMLGIPVGPGVVNILG